MPENLMNDRPNRPDKHRNEVATIIIVVVVCAILFGAIGYVVGNKKTITPEVPVEPTITDSSSNTEPAAPALASATISADATASWKTYTNDTYGFSFKYPSDWNEPSFTKADNFGDLKGSLFATWTNSTSSKLDNDGIFSMSFNTVDYQSYDGKQITKPISVEWTKSQFIEKISNVQPTIYRQLSSKSLLVGYYTNVECSPNLAIEVITPLRKDYPNLEISIIKDFSQDEIIKNADAQADKNGTDTCDLESAYTEIASKVQSGKYSDVNLDIDTAKLIADSLAIK